MMTTRRTFLSILGTLPFSAIGLANAERWSKWSSLPQENSAADPAGHAEVMDEALQLLSPYGGSFRGGLSNHGPMTAEALLSLGRPEDVIPWVTSYRKRLDARPKAQERIANDGWKDALGNKARVRDWEDWFTNELAESTWQEVVQLWIPRLAPGMAAAGLHGVIRAGHAVSSLVLHESAPRLDELARALGYWAAEFMKLPGDPTEPGKLSPSNALKKLTLLPREMRRSRGLITTELRDLLHFEPFAAAIDLADPSAGSPNFMSDLLAASAGSYIHTKARRFEFLHGVTGAAAVAELLPLVAEKDRALVKAYTWQATAGLHTRYAAESLVSEVETSAQPDGEAKARFAELGKLSSTSGDEHTIKLVAACAREWSRNPDGRVLLAAETRIARRG